MFTLESCAPIIGTKVFTFKSEEDMLLAWREFIRLADPDVFTGYNIQNFDWTYITRRGDILTIPAFPFFGRVKELPIRIREQVLQSRAMGIRDSKDVTTDGRIMFDMLTFFVREHKLRSYSLNSVSA